MKYLLLAMLMTGPVQNPITYSIICDELVVHKATSYSFNGYVIMWETGPNTDFYRIKDNEICTVVRIYAND